MAKKDKKGKGKKGGKGARTAKSPPAPVEVPAAEAWLASLLESRAARFLGRPALLIFIVFALALGVRYHVAHFYAKGPDNFQYLALARDLATGDYFQKDFDLDQGLANSRRVVPFFPALIAAGSKLGADPERWGTWVAVISGSLTVIPLFFIGVRLGNRASGVAAGLFYALMPLDFGTAGQILTESTFSLLTITAVWATIRFIDQPARARMAVVGLVSALAYLTRDIGFGYVALIALAFSAWLLKWPWKQAAVHAGVGLLVFVTVCSPFWIFVKVHTGKFSPTLRQVGNMRADLAGWEKGSRPRVISQEDQAALKDQPPPSLMAVPAKTIKLTYQYLRAVYKTQGVIYFAFVFMGVLFLRSRKRADLAPEFVVWIFVVAIAGVYALITPYMVDSRYYLPVVALACIWAGRGAGVAPVMARKLIQGNAGVAALAVVAALTLCGLGYYLYGGQVVAAHAAKFYSLENYRGKTVSGHREATEDAVKLLKIKPLSRTLMRKPFFAYYAGGLFLEIAETEAGVKQQIEEGLCDYVFIGSMSVQRYRKGLKSLVTRTEPFAGAGLVYRRYLIDYNKLFSVYQPGAPSIDVAPSDPSLAQVPELLRLAEQYQSRGYVEHARQLLHSVLIADPQNEKAHYMLMKVYMTYGTYDYVSLARAEDHLFAYSKRRPRDPSVKKYQQYVEKLRTKHKFKWGKK